MATDIQPGVSPGPASSRPRRSVVIVSLAVLLLLLTGMAEIALRIAGKGKPPHDSLAHAALGFSSPPNWSTTIDHPEHPVKRFVLPFNNYGLAESADTPALPPPGVTRIAVVGDSHTLCACPPAESFANQFEAVLNKRAGAPRFEVLNGGQGRYSPYQYYVRLKTLMLPLKPSHVIVAIYAGNDLADLVRHDDRPYLTERDGRLVHNDPVFMVHTDPNARPVLKNSALYNTVAHAVDSTIGYQVSRASLLLRNVAYAGYGPVDAFRYMTSVKKLTDIGVGLMTQVLHQANWFKHFPATTDTALRYNREVIRLFRELGAAEGFSVTYVLVPSKTEIEPEDLQDKWRKVAAYDPALTGESVAAFNRMYLDETRKAAKELNVETVDLRDPLLARKVSGKRLYFREDMHLTPEGHAAVGEILADALQTRVAAVGQVKP
jgi:hypothetical protein